MKINKLVTIVAMVCVSSSSSSFGALRIHKPQSAPESPVVVDNALPENTIVAGRARQQLLVDAMKSITRNKMTVEFVDPELKEMKINWRANNEPLQIILTQLSRGYQIDVVLNEPKETIYVSIDKGQCDAARERELLATKRMWKAMNIDQMPSLPARLALPIDAYGHEYRLC